MGAIPAVDLSFRDRVASTIDDAVRAGGSRELRHLLPRLRGVPPDLVWTHLRPRVESAPAPLAVPTNPEAPTMPSGVHQPAGLEPHPLDFDWRFISTAVDRLVDELLPTTGSVLLMGAPSLLPPLLRRRQDVRLIDRNPLVADQPGSVFRSIDLRVPSVAEPLTAGSCVFFDSPWYPSDLKAWLRFAALSLPSGGRVLFSLWPELVRPTAESERKEILGLLDRHGDVDLEAGTVGYEVPLFEKVAFQIRGIDIGFPWRVGDLARYLLRDPGGLLQELNLEIELAERPSLWLRLDFDGRQLALRTNTPSGTPALSIPEGFSTWYSDSVSLRDTRRSGIDFWASTNFIAAVRAGRSLASWLLGVAHGSDRVDLNTPGPLRPLVERLIAHRVLPSRPPQRVRAWMHLG